jgi:multiple sugar transport system substrate-binding protein
MEKPDQYYKQIITQGTPDGNDGKPLPSLLGVSPCLIPKGAKNIDGAKALLRAFIQPDNLNKYLKETRGRFMPVMMSNVRNDPYWQDPADPHRPAAVQTGLVKPTMPWWMCYNPAYAAVLSEQIWSQAEANITQKNMTPDQATEEAVRRIKPIFERFQIA